MKKNLLLLICLTILLLGFTPIGNVQSSPEPKMFVDPPTKIDQTLGPGQNFTVKINISNVEDMWAFEIKLGWSPALLDVPDNPATPGIVEGITEGPFLKAGNKTRLTSRLDQTAGTLFVACTLYGTLFKNAWPVSGNGTLLTVKFTVEQVGATILELYETRVIVIGDPPYYEPEATAHISEDGFFSNVIHYSIDTAITEVTPLKTVVSPEFNLEINITLQNQGNITEGFSVKLYYGSNSQYVGTRMATLSSGASTTLTWTWYITGITKGEHTITVNASVAPGETDIADNTRSGGTFRVTMPGDVSEEFGIVDIFDLVYVGASFGATKGQTDYKPNADINGDGIIDIFDLVIVGANFGSEDCP